MSFSKLQMPLNLKLRYRNSFIDVDDDDEDTTVGSQVRASSTPPAFLRDQEVDESEDGLRFYVETLSKRFQEPEEKGNDVSPSDASTTGEGTPSSKYSSGQGLADWNSSDGRPILPSSGSLGHPEVCRRPCIYFMAGHCANGNECTYCHLPHVEKTPKLDKRQRTIMQGLSRRELLALVLHFCRVKARQAGMETEAKEVLQLMEEEAGGATALNANVSERDARNLHKTLARMNFSNLIGLVTHQSPSRASAASAENLADALERLRGHFLRA